MTFEIRRLGKFLVAAIKRTNVRPVTRMDTNVCPIKISRVETSVCDKRRNMVWGAVLEKIIEKEKKVPKLKFTKQDETKSLIREINTPNNCVQDNLTHTVYLKLKSKLNLLPQPSNVHWNGFSPVCTNWWRFSLLDSTKAFPHSAQTWTLGPCVCRCFLMAELSLNILLQPLCGQAN